jgi:predicted RNA binding protein YcfA (HicA-like mRNA interferase family)
LSEVPSLSYLQIIQALQRFGFVIVRQRGSHIRLQKRLTEKIIKITVPAHKPVHPNTLRNILKQADISLTQFKELL